MLTQSNARLIEKLRLATGDEDWGILEDADLIEAADTIERLEKALADVMAVREHQIATTSKAPWD